MRKRLLAVVGLLAALALPAAARERISGWCEQGGNTVTVGGLTSTEDVQESFASCTVTVYDVGTLDIADIFSDDSGTIKANPFTAASTGFWFWYADDARYDIRFSGGGISTPFTLGDFLVDDTKNDVTTIVAVSSSATPTFDASLGTIFTNTLTANVTSSTISNPVTGQRITIYLAQDATGGRTFAWPANVQLRGGTYIVSPAASAVSVIDLYYDGTNWRDVGRLADASDETVLIQNNIIYVDGEVGADLGAKIVNCIARLPATGGTCDARGLEGAQAISTSIVVNKPVAILLGYTTITCSANFCFDFTDAGDFSSLIGVGIGNTSGVGGTQITAASSGITPLIRVAGTSGAARAVKIRLENFQLNGTDTLDLQTGIFYNFFTDIQLTNIQFVLLGQAEDIDAGALIYHFRCAYDRVGTGGTPATAGIRVENRSDPAGVQLTQLRWDDSLWQGDNAAGNNKQGTPLYFEGTEVSVVWLTDSTMDFDATNPDFPLVVFNETRSALVGGNSFAASTITTANAVIDLTGDATNRATNIQLYDNRVAFSNTVTGVRFDFGSNNYLSGGIMRGQGGGTAVTITVNQNGGSVGPFQMGSTDTPISNSSTSVLTLAIEPVSLNAWHMPEGLAVGTTPATAGEFRLPNDGTVRGRNAADSANITMMSLNSADDVALGDTASAGVRVRSNLSFGDSPPVAAGILGPNNECYNSLDAGGAAVCIMNVDTSDILQIGDDSDLVSIEIGAAAVPTAIGGALEYRDAPLLAASTTPSVTGGNLFLTNSTASITDFTGELNGQVIILLCGADTTTSLVDSTPLFLATAFTCSADDSIMLVSDGTVWTELSRSVN